MSLLRFFFCGLFVLAIWLRVICSFFSKLHWKRWRVRSSHIWVKAGLQLKFCFLVNPKTRPIYDNLSKIENTGAVRDDFYQGRTRTLVAEFVSGAGLLGSGWGLLLTEFRAYFGLDMRTCKVFSPFTCNYKTSLKKTLQHWMTTSIV